MQSKASSAPWYTWLASYMYSHTRTHTYAATVAPPGRHTEVDGTLAEFVEAFIPVLDLHLRHRSTLDRQTLSALQYHQNARPGMLGFDVDYGQNFDVKKALEVQSEHWNTLSVTLFMEIASWIKTAEWDKSEGALEAGAEVTGQCAWRGARTSAAGEGGSARVAVDDKPSPFAVLSSIIQTKIGEFATKSTKRNRQCLLMSFVF